MGKKLSEEQLFQVKVISMLSSITRKVDNIEKLVSHMVKDDQISMMDILGTKEDK